MLELVGDRNDLLVDELPYGAHDLGLDVGEAFGAGQSWHRFVPSAAPVVTREYGRAPGPSSS